MVLEGEYLDHADERTRAAGGRLLKVIDFGLARSFAAERHDESLVTQTDAGFIGTPAYASPEQGAGGNDLDGRSDLYSLGIILWQMLAGRLPFNGPVIKVLIDHQRTPLPFEQLVNVPPPQVELLGGLLAKEPAARWPQSAGELRDKLDELLREMGDDDHRSAASAADFMPTIIGERPPTQNEGRVPTEVPVQIETPAKPSGTIPVRSVGGAANR